MASLDYTLLESSTNVRLPSPFSIFFQDARFAFTLDELGLEIMRIAFPAALALMADPIASLVDTAFIGQIGPVELAAVGVSIAVFNQASRITIFPLVSVTTSFVAEEDATSKIASGDRESGDSENIFSVENEMKELIPHDDQDTTVYDSTFSSGKSAFTAEYGHRKYIPSVSSAIAIGGVLGVLQTLFLVFGAKPLLNIMGVQHDSPMMIPACRYLTLRSLGAPAVLLSLAMQGVFRGLKDTKTPLCATVAGDATNIILDPIFMFVFQLGVSGAAIAHVISQYLIALILLWRLQNKVVILPPSICDLQFDRFLKNGGLLLVRVISVTFCVTLSASMAARQGSTPMAAFQICLQIWLATSLVADGLAVAGQWGMILGLIFCTILGASLRFASRLFTTDTSVLQLIYTGIPFVALTQPINALAFVFDGINFGASDFAYFAYSAYSMVLVAITSIICLVVLPSAYGFIGIWIALTIYMSLRMLAGFWRIGTAKGPWTFLKT